MGAINLSFRLQQLVLAVAVFSLTANAQQPTRPHLEKGFVANRGQVHDQFREPNPDVLFLWAGRSGMNVQVRKDGLSYDTYMVDQAEQHAPVHFHRLDMRMLGIADNVKVIGERPRGGKLNFSGWGSNGENINEVPHFSTVRYTGIYPGVDMELSLNGKAGNAFKYDLILHPGAAIDHIRLRFDGFDSVAVKDGQLDFMLSGRHLTESIPHSWTLPGNERVEVHYRVIEQSTDHLVVGLELAHGMELTAGSTLVIDPDPIVQWSTYYGDTAYDAGNAITTDREGFIYMAGSTLSIDNIATGQGLYEAGFVGAQDVFLMKFLPWGAALWCTYYGGESWDIPVGLKINAYAHLYMVGNTTSALGIASMGAQQDSLAGVTDAFVARFDTSGHRIWGTYLGGALKDSAAYCALDISGGLLVVGTTWSASFNADSLPALNSPAGGADAFVARKLLRVDTLIDPGAMGHLRYRHLQPERQRTERDLHAHGAGQHRRRGEPDPHR
ncbi:MAG: SBBP repeat-containing protein, partial [Flavobacteriales bacterium]